MRILGSGTDRGVEQRPNRTLQLPRRSEPQILERDPRLQRRTVSALNEGRRDERIDLSFCNQQMDAVNEALTRCTRTCALRRQRRHDIDRAKRDERYRLVAGIRL